MYEDENLDEAQEIQETEETPEPSQEAAESSQESQEAEPEEMDVPEEETPQEAAESSQEATEAEPEEMDAPEEETPQEASGVPQALSMPKLGAMLQPLAADPAAEEEEQESDEEYETLQVNDLDIVKLGRQGEHLTQEVQIDCGAWLGSGSALEGCELLIAAIRPGENEVYLPTVTEEDGVITWAIQDQDTACAGWGRGEVRAMKDGKIKKSAVFRTRVEPSLEGSGSVPATPPDWVQTILASTGAAEEAAQAASEAAGAAAQSAAATAAGLPFAFVVDPEDGGINIKYEYEEE